MELRAVREFEHLIARGIRLRGLLRFRHRGAREHDPAVHDLHALRLVGRFVVEDEAVEINRLGAAQHPGECTEQRDCDGDQSAKFHQRS